MKKNQLILEKYNGKTVEISKGQEGVPTGMLRAEGTLAVVETVNRNGRYYKADMYKKLVEGFKQRIEAENGIFGEMEHPRSMNINLNNVSHKIEDISFNESTGEVRGKILLLDTPTGRIAQSILKSGSNLPISSRAIGKINEDSSVDVKFLGTFDLVGTAGFAQAKMQVAESKNEGGFIVAECYAFDIDEAGNVLSEGVGYSQGDLNAAVEAAIKKMGLVTEAKALEIAKTYILEEAGPKIKNFVTEAQGENAESQESADKEFEKKIDERFVKVYSPIIQKWVTEEYTPTIEKWVTEEFAPVIESWVTNEFSPVIENWAVREFGPQIGKWVTEEFAPTIQKWVTEQYSPTIQNWTKTEFASNLQAWLQKEFVPTLQLESASEQQKIKKEEQEVKQDLENAGSETEKEAGTNNKKDQVAEDCEVASTDTPTMASSVDAANASADDQLAKDEKLAKKDVQEVAEAAQVASTDDNSAKSSVNAANDTASNQLSKDEGQAKKPVEEPVTESRTSILLSQLDQTIAKAKSANRTLIVSEDQARNKALEAINETFDNAKENWLKFIPESFKAIWIGMNDEQKNAIRKQASIRVMEGRTQVQKFWETRDFSKIVTENAKALGRENGLGIVNESASEGAPSAGMKQLASLSKLLNGRF